MHATQPHCLAQSLWEQAAAIRRGVERLSKEYNTNPGSIVLSIINQKTEALPEMLSEIGMTVEPPAVRAILNEAWHTAHDIQWGLAWCTMRRYLHATQCVRLLRRLDRLKQHLLKHICTIIREANP